MKILSLAPDLTEVLSLYYDFKPSLDTFPSFFVTAGSFWAQVARFFPIYRIRSVICLLKRSETEFMQYFLSQVLNDLGAHLGFESGQALLKELLHQRLLEQWDDRLDTIPYMLFDYNSIEELMVYNSHLVIPMLLRERDYKAIDKLAIVSGKTTQWMLNRVFEHAVLSLVPLHQTLDDLYKDERWIYLANSVESGDITTHIKGLTVSLISKMLQITDDDNGLESDSANSYAQLLKKMSASLPRPRSTPRPVFYNGFTYLDIMRVFNLIQGTAINPISLSSGDLQNLLQLMDEDIECQVFDYERERILLSGYRILISLSTNGAMHPLTFYMVTRTMTRYMKEPSLLYPLSSVLLHVYKHAAKHHPTLVSETAMSLFGFLTPLVEQYKVAPHAEIIYYTMRSILHYIETIDRDLMRMIVLQMQIKTRVFRPADMKSICPDDEQILSIHDVFDFKNPSSFRFTMVDSLDMVLSSLKSLIFLENEPEYVDILLERCLQIVRGETDQEDVLVKLGGIIGSIIGFSDGKSRFLGIDQDSKEGNLLALDEVFNGLFDPEFTVAGAAAKTIALAMSNNHLRQYSKNLAADKSKYIDILLNRHAKRRSRPRTTKVYSSPLETSVWEYQGDEKEWVATFANSLLVAYEKCDVLSYMGSFLELRPKSAKTLIPCLVFNMLDNAAFKQTLEHQLRAIFSKRSISGHANHSVLAMFLQIVEHIRKQQHPQAKTPFQNNILWLDVDYYDLASTALQIGLHKHALMLAEIGIVSSTDRELALGRYRSLLVEIYKHLEDSDGFTGVLMLMDPQDFAEPLVEQKFEYQKSWDRLTQAQQSHLNDSDAQSLSHIATSLRYRGDFQILEQYSRGIGATSDAFHESLWRNRRWSDIKSIRADDGKSFYNMFLISLGPNLDIYKCLTYAHLSLHDFREATRSALLNCISQVRIEKADCAKIQYSKSLQSLVILSEFQESLHILDSPSGLERISNLWDKKRESFANHYDFTVTEHLLASRSRLLEGLISISDSPLLPGLQQYYSRHLLAQSKLCRKAGHVQAALEALESYKKLARKRGALTDGILLGFSDVQGVIERLEVLHVQGEQSLAIKCLKGLLESINTEDVLLTAADQAKCYGLLGEWIANSKSENAVDAINKYLSKAVKASSTTYGKNFYRLAKYADEHYQELLKDHESLGAIQAELTVYRQEQLDSYTSFSNVSLTDQEKHKIQMDKQRLRTEIELDKREIRRHEKERYEFLNLSVENYLKTLQSTDTQWDMCVFRILSLWFAHTSKESGINTRIANFIQRIPSKKFLVVMYQLSARILSVNSGEEEFQDVLTSLLEKMCLDHPYHCLYQIIALTNTERLKQKSGLKDLSNASTLLSRMKQKRPLIVQHLEFMCNGYMSLAMDPVPKTIKSKDKKIPIKTGNPLLRAHDLQSIPPITMEVPVDDTCQYKDIPTIVRFEETYWIPGGINAPKVITCHATNGQVYTQLVKGNGIFLSTTPFNF